MGEVRPLALEEGLVETQEIPVMCRKATASQHLWGRGAVERIKVYSGFLVMGNISALSSLYKSVICTVAKTPIVDIPSLVSE